MSNPNLPPSPIQLFDWIAVLQCVAIKESRDGLEAGHIVQQGLRVSMEGMTVTNIGQRAWEFTCFMRGKLFWNEEETVLQIHPPKSQYVNNHPYCLHLWKDTAREFVLPPVEAVGILKS